MTGFDVVLVSPRTRGPRRRRRKQKKKGFIPCGAHVFPRWRIPVRPPERRGGGVQIPRAHFRTLTNGGWMRSDSEKIIN